MDKVGVLDPPRCSMVFSWLCRLKKPKAFRCKDQKIFDPTLPINSFWKNIVGIMKAIKCISWIFPQNKKTLQHGMLRISLSVSLYLKYMVIPFPLRIFSSQQWTKIIASLRDSSVKHFSEARLGVLANQLLGISSMVGWGGCSWWWWWWNPHFLFGERQVCAPPKKKTYACFWLFAGVKNQLCLCTILYPYLKNKRSVLRGFDVLFWRPHAWNHRLSCIWRSCWDTPQQKNKQMYIQKSKLDRKMSMSLSDDLSPKWPESSHVKNQPYPKTNLYKVGPSQA